MYSKQLIVFDWDGTLMDSESRIVNCMTAAIRDAGMPQRDRETIKNIIGLGLREALQTLFPEADDDAMRRLIEGYRHHFLYADQTPSELFTGVVDMLDALNQRGYFLAIATGKARAGLNRALSESGLEQFFHASRCADETRSKPHPQMLEELLDYFGLEADEAIMVGDTEYDLAMANNARTHSVAVSYGVHQRDRLLQHRPLACLENTNQLHAWIVENVSYAT